MKRFFVIAYDIDDDKRRREVVKLLEAVGLRVNKSVFECFLSDTKLNKLKASLAKRLTSHDAVLYYPLCKSCLEKVERHGTTGLPVEVVKVF